ncbi:MAG TPA: hypothetical protein PKG49_12235, partial [Nitrosomonas mobilis]|nr:hypothetical protein [Nitrosomonas mobilis]
RRIAHSQLALERQGRQTGPGLTSLDKCLAYNFFCFLGRPLNELVPSITHRRDAISHGDGDVGTLARGSESI